MGALLIVLAAAALVFDPPPWYPLLLVLALGAGLAACRELVGLLSDSRLRPWVCHLGVAVLLAANWPAHVLGVGQPWHWILGALTGSFMAAFLVKAAYFQEPGGAIVRLALTVLVICYLGLLSAFLLQLRWLPGEQGSLALALAVFVPKSGDIGAYFTGRLLGRHPLAPLLSPKKTWEGAAGGLLASVLAALGIHALGLWMARELFDNWYVAAGFGLVVGVAAQLGDLMESFIKRDSQQKDASQTVPGFGGVLDVLDSILFSAPVSYAYIAVCTSLVVRS
jgi:phosphatidate cytidylyltransferase